MALIDALFATCESIMDEDFSYAYDMVYHMATYSENKSTRYLEERLLKMTILREKIREAKRLPDYFYVKGDFEWEDDGSITKAVFIENPKGKWNVLKVLNEKN